MNKKLLVAGGLGLAYLLFREGQNLTNTINGLSFSYLPAGLPRPTSNGLMSMPVGIYVKNPGSRDLPLGALNVTVFRELNGQSYRVASTPAGGVILPSFKAGQITKFTLDIEIGLFDALTEAVKTFQKRGFNLFRIESAIGSGNAAIPLPPFKYTL